jgi:hypothetical protein
MICATRIVDCCVQWLQLGGQAAQWALAMAEVRPARISALSYRLEGDELIIHNAKCAKKLVQCGRAGCVARALMSCGVVESCEHTFGKLLSKLQQADLLETQPLVDLLAGHNFKKGQIMHIVNSIPKGTVPGMDDNRTRHGWQSRRVLQVLHRRCRNPTLAKCGGEAQHLESGGFGVLRDSRMFRARQQGGKTPRLGVFSVSLERS